MAAKQRQLWSIDRTLKKVNEGRQVFQETLTKFEQAATQTQKEKFEADLKKEIKKLQRFRDQIKTWLTSNEVKDKKILQDARKEIETDMERFKVIEKETKTKAYSKEGLELEAKKDPLQKEKEELEDWFKHIISELNIHTEKLEFDIELASTNARKKRNDREKSVVESKRSKLEELRLHINWCEACMRCLDNDNLDLEKLKSSRDDIEYFASSADYDFDMGIYEDLIIDHSKLESDTFNVSNRVVGHGDGEITSLEQEAPAFDLLNTNESDLSKELNSVAHNSLIIAVSSNNGTTDNGSNYFRQRHKSLEDKPVAQSSTIKSSSPGLSTQTSQSGRPGSKPASTNGTCVNSIPIPLSLSTVLSSTSPPSLQSNRSNTVAIFSSAPVSIFSPTTPAVAAPLNGLSSTTSFSAAVSTPLQQSIKEEKKVAAFEPITVISSTLLDSPPTLPIITKQQPVGTVIPGIIPMTLQHFTKEPTSVVVVSDELEVTQAIATQCEHHPVNGNSDLHMDSQNLVTTLPQFGQPNSIELNQMLIRGLPLQSLNASQSSIDHSNLLPLLDSNLRQQQAASVFPTFIQEKLLKRSNQTKPLNNVQQHLNNFNDVKGMSAFGAPGAPSSINQQSKPSDALLLNSIFRTHTQSTVPQSGLSSFNLSVADACAPFRSKNLPAEYFTAAAQMLEMGYRRASKPEDSNRARMTLLKLPPPYETKYPKEPIVEFHTEEYYSKLDAPTLFFIFYYFEGSRAQYLASKALKKKSWRFHKQHYLWFQRLEEPRSIDEDYESGTYVYWDVETKSLGKREDFKFEYRYLEDCDLT